ncbi:nitroreductase family protein [[Mycoplasma] testudinis]|uniref:nitroreductase family protein n=1 Tax=[Mycoplasma] testudinis TaxID=33924 RepID=UPI0004885729|nr:nitroreductase family protein [[Mycoplasma] testudinis]
MINENLHNFFTRTSVRSYEKTPLKPEHEKAILDIINSAPTFSNGHDFSAIVIKDQVTRDLIAGDLPHQQQIKQAPLFVLFCADWNRIDYADTKNNLNLVTNDLDQLLVGTGDAFIAATMAQDVALSLNVSTCFIGLVRANLAGLIKLLNISGRAIPMIGMTFGYAAEKNEIKPKMNKLFFEKYNRQELQTEVDKYDQIFAEYYASRSTNKKINQNWSSSMSYSYNDKATRKTGKFMKSIWKFEL